MLTRSALALALLLPCGAYAQELDSAVSAVVSISGTRGGTPVRGSGFVVGLDRGKATIVTASHVVEGAQQLTVTFAVDPTKRLPAGEVLGMDAGSPNGLAVFQVGDTLPAGLTSLSFEVESRPRFGEAVFLLGFPQMELAPRTTQRAAASAQDLNTVETAVVRISGTRGATAPTPPTHNRTLPAPRQASTALRAGATSSVRPGSCAPRFGARPGPGTGAGSGAFAVCVALAASLDPWTSRQLPLRYPSASSRPIHPRR